MTSAVFHQALDRVCGGGEPRAEDLATLLGAVAPDQIAALHEAAYAVKVREVGKVVYFRGLIELGNLCVRDCVYCGIRRDNTKIERFTLSLDEIVEGARLAHEFGYGSLVLQGGEREDEAHTDFIAEALEKIHAATGSELAITLSLGEQTREVYRRWRQAGAHRYLLRMETTDHNLYAELHPDRTDWEARRRCLDYLREEEYHVGTGVMIGLPGQSLAQMAQDLLFYRDQDVDMIGMGPYIPHEDTPLGHHFAGFDAHRQLRLGLNMIACTRLLLPDANIASTTALQALDPHGREQGLLAGANVIMPNVTDTRHRASYQLYNGKPGLQENAPDTRARLDAEIAALGETVGYGERGDAPRAVRRGLGKRSSR
jgi:biotin synthase